MAEKMDSKKVRCAFCGAEMTELDSNNPQDYLHPEYEKYIDPRFTDTKPRYCCSYCNGITSINRALYGFIHVEESSGVTSPYRVARTLEDEADYLEKNADKIEKYYAEMREKAAKEDADGGSNGEN